MVSARPTRLTPPAAPRRIAFRKLIPFLLLAGALPGAHSARAATSDLPSGYPGLPYQGKVQEIPGRVFLSDFDQGPKDVAWHDFEARNVWACKVRDSTAVGLQLMGQGGDKGDTKEADSLVKARMGKCYLAQTNSGDWTKYTVRVKQKGDYSLAMLSTASETQVPFVAVSLLNGKDSTGSGQITLPITTYFHHWVYTRDLKRMSLDTGLQVLRFDIPGNGPMNIDYIDFTLAGPSALKASATDGNGGPSVRGIVREAGGATRVDFRGGSAGTVRVRVFAASGARIFETEAESKAGGISSVRFRAGRSAAASSPGLLFVKLEQGGASSVFRTLVTGP
jgi:hypothetical protein